LTLEAIQSFGLASSGKHSGKHNSPGGEGLAGYRHGRRAASAPASRTAAVSLGTPKMKTRSLDPPTATTKYSKVSTETYVPVDADLQNLFQINEGN